MIAATPPHDHPGTRLVGPGAERSAPPGSEPAALARDARRRLEHLGDLLRELVAREMKIRYKRSVLGIAWTLLNPLAQMLVFAFVFRRILPLGVPDYPWFLMTGILAWGWFQSSLISASTSIVDGGALIKQPGFPAAILPVVAVTTQLVHFLLALGALIPFLALTGHRVAPALLALPLLIAAQFLLCLSLAYVFAPLQVTFRDTQYTLGVFLMLGFYLTPVFYESSSIPTRYWPIYRLNPMVHLIDAYRDVLLLGAWPAPAPLLVLAALSAGVLGLGVPAFVRASHHFVEEL